jgi:histidine triad (HIT) family protein
MDIVRDPDCLFCKIVAGEVPSKRIYENEEILVFHDVSPQAPFHALIIPKNH